jgi:hypothetical protein
MHDNDGVEAFVCFTSIPCGHDPRLSIGHFGTIAYIYKAIKSCQQDRDPASSNDRADFQYAFSHTSIVSYPSPCGFFPRLTSSIVGRLRQSEYCTISLSFLSSRSAKSVSFPASEWFRSFVLPLRSHLFLCMGHRCWISAAFLTRTWPILEARVLGGASGTLRLTTALVHCCALFAVGVDAALGEVVGATTC